MSCTLCAARRRGSAGLQESLVQPPSYCCLSQLVWAVQQDSAQGSGTLCGASQTGRSRRRSQRHKCSELRAADSALPLAAVVVILHSGLCLALSKSPAPEHLARYMWLVCSCWDLTRLPLSPAAHSLLLRRWLSPAIPGTGIGCDAVQAVWVASTVRIPFAQPAAAQQVRSCCRLVSRRAAC